MPFNVFSARRIATPGKGILALHPLVDVLEGRRFMSASVHDGVLTIDADDDDQSLHADAPRNEMPLHGDRVDDDGAPEMVVMDDAASVFSDRSIDASAEVMFSNLFHNRRGRPAPLALPAPEQIAQEGDETSDESESQDRFASRPLGGTMRPYLVARLDAGEETPFA